MANVVTDAEIIVDVRRMEALFFAGGLGETIDRICDRILREFHAGRWPSKSIAAVGEAGRRLEYASLVMGNDDEACSAWETARARRKDG